MRTSRALPAVCPVAAATNGERADADGRCGARRHSGRIGEDPEKSLGESRFVLTSGVVAERAGELAGSRSRSGAVVQGGSRG
jgi:hypothetical protein